MLIYWFLKKNYYGVVFCVCPENSVGNIGMFSLVLKVVAKNKGLFLIPQMKWKIKRVTWGEIMVK